MRRHPQQQPKKHSRSEPPVPADHYYALVPWDTWPTSPNKTHGSHHQSSAYPDLRHQRRQNPMTDQPRMSDHEGQDFNNFTPGNHSFVYVLPKPSDAMPHITNVPLFFRLHHTDRDVVSTGEQHDHPFSRQHWSQSDLCKTGWYKDTCTG